MIDAPSFDAIERATGLTLDGTDCHAIGGGCINDAVRVATASGPVFVKFNRADRLDMFVAEADGLAALRDADVRAPRVLGYGSDAGTAFLVLEWFEMGAPADPLAAAQQVLRLHACAGEFFGWTRDNYIGSTPQDNTPNQSWSRFFIEARLRPQLELAGDDAELYGAGMKLLERAGPMLDDSEITPVLLHGDLWGGNWAMTADGACLFDPAVHYGDREADIAMTELFGGFGPDFYRAYREVHPEREGNAGRRRLYKLYHVLNHFNLFGGGYRRQARQLIDHLLSPHDSP
ncbi:MAG: phosphotransferase [Gammaproteobacteria bacterium]|nr:phosphotransferase [Gammaproteobacteria bacterium]